MSQIRRKDALVDEGIEILEQHFRRSKYDISVAWNTLSSVYVDFIHDELRKCMSDPRYYLENYHVVKTEYEGFKTLYPFWDSQEIFYREVMDMVLSGKPAKIMVLKARQLGLSTVSEGLIFHRTIFNETLNTLIVAQDTGQADYLFTMSVRAYENLPWWMRPEIRYRSKGRYMTFDSESPERRGLNSEIFVEAANKITGVSVGKTIRAAHLSELSDWDNPQTLTEQIFPTMNSPDTLAIMESTARGRQGFWYEFWKKSINKWGDGRWPWKPVFIEWFRCPDKYSLALDPNKVFEPTKDEVAFRDKVIRETEFYIPDEMLNWKRMKIDETSAIAGDEFGFFQEYPSNWIEAFQSSGVCAFPKRKLNHIVQTICRDPRWFGEIQYNHGAAQEIKTNLTEVYNDNGQRIFRGDIPSQETHGGRLRIWEKPERGESYYIGADPAHGLEGRGDFSCVQIIRIGRGGSPDFQVAEWRGWINPTPFGHIVVGLAKWYNECEIALEMNSSVGEKTYIEIFRILEYANLFRWKHYDKLKNFYTDYMAWFTNHKTRDLIIANMRERVEDNTIILYSSDLLEEMLDFSADEEGGRFEGQNTNDDRIMAMMIAAWCAHDSDYGKAAAMKPSSNLGVSKFYALDPDNKILAECDSYDEAKRYVMSDDGFLMKAGFSIATRALKTDFNNTEFSPVHDRPGPRQRMHYAQNIPAEMISLHNLVDDSGTQDSDDWRNH